LYFFPEPQGHGAFRPTLGVKRVNEQEMRKVESEG
jgi:hypothetical protein